LTSAYGARNASSPQNTSMSHVLGHASLFFRKMSRTRRFTEFRSTARLRSFFGALIPRRVLSTSGTSVVSHHLMRTSFPLKERPVFCTRVKSACVLSRSRGRNTSPAMLSTCAVRREDGVRRVRCNARGRRATRRASERSSDRARERAEKRKEENRVVVVVVVVVVFSVTQTSAPTEGNCFFRHEGVPHGTK
jgi:hypothetical protein